MGALIDGDDKLPAEVVGRWAKEKHSLLCKYVQISSATRKKYLGPGKGGAAYVDLFCGPGRAFIEENGDWIEGGAVSAWRQSQASGSPFSRVVIGDADEVRLRACESRLQTLGAPVVALLGTAKDTASLALQQSPSFGLNFAFLDPYSLEALDFSVIKTLARLKRIDMLIHVSTMDLQRNLDIYLKANPSPFDAFAPGWRETLDMDRSKGSARIEIYEYWRRLVAETGVAPSDDVKLITGTKNQRLYWLLLAARHDLAQKFWSTIARDDERPSLF